jgi:UDP-glucose:(heptosyl)LPS alpha-1,3-glucosyltransferase
MNQATAVIDPALRASTHRALPAPSRRLRLALVRQQYKGDGGAERSTAALIDALGEQEHEVTLFARRWQGGAGVTAVRCDPPRLGRLSRDWGFAISVGRQLRRYRFDLVQSNERVPGCDIYRAGDGVHRQWLAHRRRAQSWPARLLSRISPYHAYLQWTERRLFEHPRLRAVICNSHMVRGEILKYFQIDPAKLHVIYNGVDSRRFGPHLARYRAEVRAELGISPTAPLFIFVGSGFERKGLRYALQAIADVPETHLLVVGGDRLMSRYKRLAQSLGIANRTSFTGVVSEVGRYYGAADVLLLPTLYDPMPNVALEAMATGLPLLVSPSCGAAELVEEKETDGPCGLVCDPLDCGALVRAVQSLTDLKLVRRLGTIARSRVEPLTPEAMAAQLTELYRTLLK